MALRPNTNADPESFAQGSTRQTGESTVHGSVLLGTTAMFPDAHDLQIANSNFTIAGRDVHNHYHSESKRDIWAILKLVPNFRDIYHDMLEKATQGTGMWLIKGPKFRVWLEPNGDIKIFWGSGIPGAGKTVLASIVIEYLEGLRKESGGTICICYIYFRYSDRLEMTVRDVLEILIKQTLERHPECQELVEHTYAQHLKEGSAPTAAQLLAVLQELASRMACTFYILDALDEAPARIQLAVVRTLAQLNVKLFITSRPLETVQAKFPHAHAIAIAAQDADLDLHIAKAIGESPELQDLLDQEGVLLKQEIVDTIKENCGGMFLHASLQLEALRDCISTQQVRRMLKAFPSSIKDVYHYTWHRILRQNAEHVALAKAVLIWVLHASRSMTVEELRRAVATSPNTHKFQPDRVVPSTTLISLCRGLVTVEEESGLVRLVHYTAKDTLEGLLHDSFPHPHSLLATICMTHLTECRFQNTTISSEQELRTILDEDPLLTYASKAWYLHACASLEEEETKNKTTQFIKECSAFPAFTSVNRTGWFDILTPLHIMALYKLPMTLMEGMAMGDPNLATTKYQETPLIVAAGSGYEGLVVYLLALHETQVNLVDNAGWSALIWAARDGHEAVVKLLLAHPSIQVNLVDNNGWSALIWAARRGHEGVIKLLVAHPGVQVNLVDNNGWSALIWAARDGHEAVVKLLLAHPSIQVNLVDNNGWSALIWAARRGHEGVIKLLVAHPGVQVNLVDNNGWSALIWAARHGHEGVIKLLVAHPGVQVNLVDNNGWSALIWAARDGHEGIIKLLLAHPGVQVNLVDNNGCSALIRAAWDGHEGVVKLLLVHPGVQVNLVGNDGCSALIRAAWCGHEGVVKLLLAHPGVQVNLVGNDGCSALIRAAWCGHEGVVKLLLAHPGVQVNLVGNDGCSALIRAAWCGHEGVVKLLLAHPGVQVNLVDNSDRWSALIQAAWGGHEGIVKLLLAHPGIQVNLGTKHNSTALLVAAEYGHDAVVKLLLATNAFDVNGFDNDGDTSIKMAANRGFEAVVRLLLDTPNIDITIRSTGDGHTAMSAAQANSHNVIAKLLQDFLSQSPAVVSPQDIDQLFLQERTKDSNSDEEDSDSGIGDAFYDAEEGTEDEVDFS